MTDEKVREDRLRRAAQRQGFTLRKSRRRDPRAFDYGVYWLSSDNDLEGEFYSLDDLEAYLADGRDRQKKEATT